MKTLPCLLAASLFLISQLSAYIMPGYREFVVEGEYLNLSPSLEATGYVVRASAGVVRRFVNENTWDSGFGVIARWGFREEEKGSFSARWRYFDNNSNDRTTSNGTDLFAVALPGGAGAAVPNGGFAGFATSMIHLDYNDVDLMLNQSVFSDPTFSIYALLGVQYLDVDYKNEILYNETGVGTFCLKYRTNQCALGAKFGIDVFYALTRLRDWGNVAIHGQMTGATLISRNRSRFEYTETVTPATFNLSNGNVSNTINAAEAKAGVSFNRAYPRWVLGLEVGGDFIFYSNAIDQVTFTSLTAANTGTSFDRYSSLLLKGVYVDFGVQF